jgi:hypothetical protein
MNRFYLVEDDGEHGCDNCATFAFTAPNSHVIHAHVS